MPVTVAQLKQLTGSNRPDGELTLFVETGQLIVDNNFAQSNIPPNILDTIALYLSGHFYVLSVEGGGITYIRTGQSEERYKSFGYETYGFMTTRFGQIACALDTTGILSKMSTKDVTIFEAESYTNRKAPAPLNRGIP